MTGMPVIDLSDLPSPDVLQGLDYEAEVAALLAEFQSRYPDHSAVLESEPIMKLVEAAAYRLTVKMAEFNDGARGLMLAYATGTTLDHLAALMNVQRLVVTPADDTTDPPTPAVMETDAALRYRAQLAWEGLSTAGPEGAYQFHAREADGRVRDVAVASPTPGDVVVTILGHDGDGTVTARETVTDLEVTLAPSSAVLPGVTITDLVVTDAILGTDYRWDAATGTVTCIAGGGIPAGATITVSYERAGVLELVADRLADDDVRPLTDQVTVQSATAIPYAVAATLWLYDGPASGPVLTAAAEALSATVTRLHALGHDVTLSALYAALHQPGVQRVDLTAPAADIIVGPTEAAYCTDMTVTLGGRDV
ncbi:baseplate assembly protein [Roseospira navarrensis]|uniref:Baseplate assembly protein n=1 Tax=Roseospira navarrensis TaxID=140058 RepID=A0A7X1ZII9_9PROT|nr:baseplate J/gp47 family protein [Roseospira navarrensis]MQX37875.1 baseplate assembly protein [Roseospira navarrensis]